MRDILAFYPFRINEISYISTIQQLLRIRFLIIDYEHLKKGAYCLEDIRYIYLNWIEYCIDKKDVELITAAKKNGTKIAWVYHNRLPHNSNDSQDDIRKLRLLVELSDIIIIHSQKSGLVLSEICDISFDKIIDRISYIPHPNYINDYRDYVFPNRKELIPSPDNTFTYVLPGTINEYKNIDVFISAYKEIRNEITGRIIVAGAVRNIAYYNRLKEMAEGCDDIIIIPYYVSSLEMSRLLNTANIIVLPYNLDSSLNSGTMIMSFSYRKTVIVSNICMAEDYPNDLILKYEYADKQDHIRNLKEKMLEAYFMGVSKLDEMGFSLFDIIRNNNSKNLVERLLDKVFL